VQEKCSTPLIQAARFAETADKNARRAYSFTSDLLHVVRELAAAHGLTVAIENERIVIAARNPDAAKSLDDAYRTLDGLARIAATRLEREAEKQIGTIVQRQTAIMCDTVRATIDHAARKLRQSQDGMRRATDPETAVFHRGSQ
jgi:hypothetical protein